MKARAKKKAKPWENISIDEIQPYPSRYTKTILLSYTFLAFFIFTDTNFLGIPYNILFFIKMGVYGTLAFSLLYLWANGHPKKMLNEFISLTTVFIGIFIIGIAVFSLINGLNVLKIIWVVKDPLDIIWAILILFNYILFGLTLLLGPANLYIASHPRAQKHGYILAAIIFIFIVLSWILHI